MALTFLYAVADAGAATKDATLHVHTISAVTTNAAAGLGVDRSIILNKRMAKTVFAALETAFIGSFPDP